MTTTEGKIMASTQEYDTIITNGVCVTATDIAPLDIAIKDGKIALLAPSGSLSQAKAGRVIDAEGGYVTPGGIDCHVHLQEPSMFGKGRSADTYESGTRSAVAGGCTTIVAFAPLQKEARSPLEALQATHALARDNCYCDYGFHLLMGNANPQALGELQRLPAEGVTSIKIYMTYQALQLRDNEILSVLLTARESRILTMVHAENGDVLDWLTERLEERKMFAPKYHVNSHAPILESEATNRAIALSNLVAQTPILIVHVSDPDAALRIREAQTKGQPIYAETCPQYLFLTRDDLDKPGFEGAKYVCSPPPRTPAAQRALWTALRNGTLALLSSDHCPFRYDDADAGKRACVTPEHPVGRFRYIPNGLPGIETRLPLAFPPPPPPLTPLPVLVPVPGGRSGSGVLDSADADADADAVGEDEERLELTRFVEVTATAAAKMYGLYPRKGALLPGVSDADLVVWYPPFSSPSASSRGGDNSGGGGGGGDGDGGDGDGGENRGLRPFALRNDMLHHDVDYTPFEGRRLRNWPRWTLVRGVVLWDREGGGVVGTKGFGRFVKRERSSIDGIWEKVDRERGFDLEAL